MFEEPGCAGVPGKGRWAKMTVITAAPSVAGMLPGPDLAFVLAGVDLSAVDEFEVVEVLKAGRRLASWAASLEVRAAAELERRAVALDGDDAAEFVKIGRASW